MRSALVRRLGPFDVTLIVMGGIIGSGIFMTPSVVAGYLHNVGLILTAWVAGGVISLLAAFILAELASRSNTDGGIYGYLRDAYHPVVAFAYGWTNLLASHSGGMAAAAVTFAVYALPIFGGHASTRVLAISAIALLIVVNSLGVRQGSNVQNGLVIVKIVAIIALIVAGFTVMLHTGLLHSSVAKSPPAALPSGFRLFGLALIPVLFSYSGWQNATYVSGEIKEPTRALPLGLILGVAAVITLYILVNVVCIAVLSPYRLATSTGPAVDILRIAVGPEGGKAMAFFIAVSTLGFLSNQMLTSPRVYHAMAEDGSFFRELARVDPRTRAPINAIVAQGVIAMVIILSGRYDQILSYVTWFVFLFLGLCAIAIFVFRHRDATVVRPVGFRVPGHPYTTLFVLIISSLIVADMYISSPKESLIGIGVLLAAVPAYLWFRRNGARQ